MIKKAIQFIQESRIHPNDRLVGFTDQDRNERTFFVDSDGIANEVKKTNSRADEPLRLNTLQGLVDYIGAKFERLDSRLLLHIENEEKITLKGNIESDGGRETLVEVNAIIPRFTFDTYYNVEKLNIALQSRFLSTVDRDIVLKVIGNLREEQIQSTGDDGISQAVTVNVGISSASKAKVPNPIRLKPYRTFVEVDQPVSDFVFRMKDGPSAAVFEADGGAWRNEAIKNIRLYLEDKLQEDIENGRITIIS